jgi:hypothetical protein
MSVGLASLLGIVWLVAVAFGAAACQSGSDDGFHFGDGVSQADQQDIRGGVDAFDQWLLSVHKSKLTRFNVYADTDLSRLLSNYDAFGRGVQPGELASLVDFFGAGGALTVGTSIFIYTGPAWAQSSRTSHEFLVAHEAFHVAQFELMAESERYLSGARGAPGAPDWLIEGSADYAAARSLEIVGLRSFDESRQREERQARTVSAQLQQLESTSPVHTTGDASPYSQGFLATAMLTEAHGDAALFAFFVAAGATSTNWADAFDATFGESLPAFYARYEAERTGGFAAYAGAVSGRLLDKRGSPAWGAIAVACDHSGACETGWAGPDGRFRIGLPDGDYLVFAASPSSATPQPSEARTAVVAGSEVDIGDIAEPATRSTH